MCILHGVIYCFRDDDRGHRDRERDRARDDRRRNNRRDNDSSVRRARNASDWEHETPRSELGRSDDTPYSRIRGILKVYCIEY